MAGPIFTSTFSYNAIYFCQYRAKGAKDKTLTVYDRAPLMIPLDFGPQLILGINLHWIPRNKRQKFLDIVLNISEVQLKRKLVYKIRLLYIQLKSDPMLWGAARYAIRRYFYSNFLSIQLIPPELYPQVLGIPRYRSRFAYKYRNYKH